MQAFQQLCGFNTLMYYSATLFKQIGFNHPTAVGLIVSGTNFLFTLFALKYIDIIGRRKIMLISSPGMIIGLTLASIAFHCGTFESILKCTRPLTGDYCRPYEENRRRSSRRRGLRVVLVESGTVFHDFLCCIVCYRSRKRTLATRRVLLA